MAGIQTLGPNHLWLVGRSQILSSHDAGAHWQLEYSGPEQFTSVDAIDDSHAWAVGSDALVGTTDGGRNWMPLGEPGCPLTQVHFVSDSLGFGISATPSPPGSGGVFVTTHDAGHSWQSNPQAPFSVTSVCFTDPYTGWLGTAGFVWRTRDGGTTWHQVLDTQNPDVEHGTLSLQCAYPDGVAVEAADGGVAGNRPHAAWVSTGNDQFHQVWAAAMWPSSGALAAGPGDYPGPLSIIDPTATAWFGNSLGGVTGVALVETTQGSHVSSPVPIGCAGNALGAAFLTTAYGWVTCDDTGSMNADATVIVTTDSGRSWTVQYTASTATYVVASGVTAAGLWSLSVAPDFSHVIFTVGGLPAESSGGSSPYPCLSSKHPVALLLGDGRSNAGIVDPGASTVRLERASGSPSVAQVIHDPLFHGVAFFADFAPGTSADLTGLTAVYPNGDTVTVPLSDKQYVYGGC